MISIQQLRRNAGMTQRQLADALGVTIATVSAWERRTHDPSARQLRALAALFAVSMDEIDFERVGQKPKAPQHTEAAGRS